MTYKCLDIMYFTITGQNWPDGGIALMVKSEISEYVKVDSHKNSKIVFWFTLCGTILLSDNDINFGVVYIPPVNSKYASDNSYSELQREIL